MADDQNAQVFLEIGHVLFIDIVGYSKLLTNEQRERLSDLNRLVRETEPFRSAEAAGKLVRLPTGDGMVLAFFTSPDAPVRCALAISRALSGRTDLPLRMGIHSGPVEQVSDVNDRPNLAGAGVNTAQRVMDCGDAGHILLSARAADDLAQYAEWKAQLHPLGEVEVKHGVLVRIASLYGDGAGNPKLPTKLRRQRLVRRRRLIISATIVGILVIGIALGIWVWQRQAKLRARVAAEAAAQHQKSVAVLPFENLSTDDQNGIFASGVHREVLLDLAKLADLKVISRTSVMRYRPGADRNLKQIANDLGVAYIVEGTVQREADHVHVTVELIDTKTDAHALAETYDGKLADVLTFQSDIAQRISNQLGAKLSPREAGELASKPTQDLAAFESYIRARALMESTEATAREDNYEKVRDDYKSAAQLLEQAVARDPHFAAAYWALSEANIQLFKNEAGVEYRTRAEAALKEAQRIAPEAGETLLAESRIVYYGYSDFHKALAVLEQAAKLLPNNMEVMMTRALLYRRFGRWQECFAYFEKARELNPQDPFGYYSGAAAAIALRWWDDCDRIRDRMVRLFPRMARPARLERIVSLRFRGDVDLARKELTELNPDMQTGFAPLFYTAMWDHKYDEAKHILDEAAKYPELKDEVWVKRQRFAFVTRTPFDNTQAASEAERELEQRLRRAGNSSDEESIIETLTSVKLILGKKEEAVHLADEWVKKYPLSEDALANAEPLRWLAYVYVFTGENDRALEIYARLVHVPNQIWYGIMRYEPELDELPKDPRFAEILKQSQQPFPR